MKRVGSVSLRRSRVATFVSLSLIGCVSALAPSACTSSVADDAAPKGPLASAFAEASAETGVPERLLLAVGYVESRWHTPDAVVTRAGHGDRGTRGLMGVLDRADAPWLSDEAAKLDVSVDHAASDAATNVRVAAAVLRTLALEELGAVPSSLSAWRNVLARYGAENDPVAGHAYADEVLRIVSDGVVAEAEGGELLRVAGDGGGVFAPNHVEQGLDYPGVTWLPAREGHFTYGRTSPITHIIIHTTQGSYQSTLSWFRSAYNPYLTSTHYVIRSWDGDITQMVREWNTGHHIGGWNPFTIGIEHEGFIEEGYRWFTDAMYRSSAALVRHLCLKYGIPMDRAHILGHVEVPGASHTDPGVYWDWDYYMALVRDPNSTPPETSDDCDGLDYAGECNGDTLRYCENHQLVSVDCAARGQVCAYESDAIGNNCVEAPSDPCEGLDYAGECSGEVLRYCDNGQLIQVSCAAREQVCGYQSDAIGYNCLERPTDPCQGLDYAGECRGQTLRWCEEGQLRSVDCAARDQTCGWQSNAIGNNCL